MYLNRSRSKNKSAVVLRPQLEPAVQLLDQCAPVGQPGQVVVQGHVAEPVLGVEPGVQLDQHGGDRLRGR